MAPLCYKGTPYVDGCSVSVPVGIDILGYLCTVLVTLSKLLSVLGVSIQNRVGK